MTTWTSLKNSESQSQAQLLASLIEEADSLVIGIGAGMSAADGFTYVGPRFENAFPDFIEKYHFFDMLQASLHDFEDWQEYWAFQSRFVVLNYLDQPIGHSYIDLKNILSDKPYHIITTNADNAFWKADYDPEKIFHIQGEYGLWQCSQHCHQQTYKNDELIRQMANAQENMKVPKELIPLCPKCNQPLEINKRNEEKGMVEDADFDAQKKRYEEFLQEHQNGKVLYIEIGVGNTTPQFIKHPFWKLVNANPDSLYAVLNQKEYRLPKLIRSRTLSFTENSSSLIAKTRQILED